MTENRSLDEAENVNSVKKDGVWNMGLCGILQFPSANCMFIQRRATLFTCKFDNPLVQIVTTKCIPWIHRTHLCNHVVCGIKDNYTGVKISFFIVSNKYDTTEESSIPEQTTSVELII